MRQEQWKVQSNVPAAQGAVLLGLANGLTNKEIARQRNVSPSTINSTLTQIREKWSDSYERKGKRGWLVSEAIRRGILAPNMPIMMVLFMCSIIFTSNLMGVEVRRSSNRLSGRTTASRMVRGKRDALDVDFEFSDSTPELLMAYFETQNQDTLAPWSSAAWMQRDLLNNDERIKLWRSQVEVMAQAA
jgi:hypothetical protein